MSTTTSCVPPTSAPSAPLASMYQDSAEPFDLDDTSSSSCSTETSPLSTPNLNGDSNSYDLTFHRLPYIGPQLTRTCSNISNDCLNYVFQTTLDTGGFAEEALGQPTLATATFSFPSHHEPSNDVEDGSDRFRLMLFLAGNPIGFFSVQSGLMVAEDGTKAMFNIDDYIAGQLVHVEVHSLNLSDIVNLVAKAINVSPKLPRDLFAVEQIKISLCPFGTAFHGLDFPHGSSIETQVLLFGKHVEFSCTAEVGKVAARAAVDNFSAGPFEMRGTHTPQALLECEIGPWKQHLFADVGVALYDAESSVRVLATAMPSPQLDVFLRAKHSDLLLSQVHTGLAGPVSLNNVQNVDFIYDYRFEQKVLQRFNDSIAQMMRQVAQDDSADVSKEYEEAHEEEVVIHEMSESVIRKGKFKAIADYEYEDAGPIPPPPRTQYSRPPAPAKNKDEHKSVPDPPRMDQRQYQQIMQIVSDSHEVIGAYIESIDRLQERVTLAQKDFDEVMSKAQSAVDAAEIQRIQALEKARAALAESRQDMKDKVGRAKRRVDEARKELSIFTSTNYTARLAACKAAQGALEVAEASGKAGVVAAYKALTGVDAVTKATLHSAKVALEAARLGVQYVVLRGARGALRLFKSLNEKAFRAALKAIICIASSIPLLLTAIRTAIRIARKIGRKILLFVGRALICALSIFDLQIFHISGSLRGIFGLGGKLSKPLMMCVQGMLAFQPFHLHIGEKECC